MNIDIVRAFFKLTFKEHKPGLAAKLYLHKEYQHNDLNFTQDRKGFIDFFTLFFRENPLFKADIVMEVEGSDTIALMVRTTTQLVADYYRVKDSKIIEHWHVIQLLK